MYVCASYMYCTCIHLIFAHLEVLHDVRISEQVLQDHDGIHVVPCVGAVHCKLFRLEGGQHSDRLSYTSNPMESALGQQHLDSTH